MHQQYLPLYAFDLYILCVDLVSHVQGHTLQIPDDAADMTQVLLHLVLAGIVSHPETEQNKVCVCVCDYDPCLASCPYD